MKYLVFSLLVFAASSQVFGMTVSRSEAVVLNTGRSAEDKKFDENRHPQELLDFSKVKKGDTVVDLFPGKGYFTRLFSAMVDDSGHVIAYVPKEIEGASFKPVEAGNFAVAGLKNAKLVVTPLMEAPAKKVDVIWTSDNYHDLHVPGFIKADVAAYNKLLYKMLKPGGILIVVDHVAKEGAGQADIEKLHRIDPKQVVKEIEAAGFVFDAENKVLSHHDDHTLNVFDPTIRGKTDQFAFRFIKPKSNGRR